MSIPAFWQEHLQTKIERIRNLQSRFGDDGVSFAMITDIHWSHNAQYSAELLERVLTACDIPYYFNGGDVACFCPYGTKEHLKSEFDGYKRAFAAIEHKCLITLGNHDGVYSTLPEPNEYSQNITKAEAVANGFAFLKKYENRVFGEDGTYYYADDRERKTRYIVLNTHDVPSNETDEMGRAVYNTFRMFCIRQPQLKWFAHVALSVPSRAWSVVLCSHENGTAKPHHKTRNHALILGIIDAFKRGAEFKAKTEFDDQPYLNADISVDFTGKGGNFIAWVAGHVHEDKIVEENGVVSIATSNDSYGSAAGYLPPHVQGTITEHTFDVFTVDKRTRQVFVTRIGGVGGDRTFSYE